MAKTEFTDSKEKFHAQRDRPCAGGWLALGNEAALKRLKPLKSIQDQYIGSMMISIY
jgi:hypothetical protein